MIGSDSLKEELMNHGIDQADENPEYDSQGISSEELDNFELDPDVGAVV